MTAIVSSKMAAIIISILPVVAFAAGAWAQDFRMRDHYCPSPDGRRMAETENTGSERKPDQQVPGSKSHSNQEPT